MENRKPFTTKNLNPMRPLKHCCFYHPVEFLSAISEEYISDVDVRLMSILCSDCILGGCRSIFCFFAGDGNPRYGFVTLSLSPFIQSFTTCDCMTLLDISM